MTPTKKPLWPVWFPYPSSWISALTLSLLLAVVIVIARITGNVGYFVARHTHSLEILVSFGILALISPIPTIAFAHHLLHRFLGHYIPAIQAPEIGRVQGFVPGLISWWEGLYGWLVLVLSTLTASAICTAILPLFDLSYKKIYYNELIYSQSQAETTIEGIFTILCIVFAASLYQIEYLVKHRLKKSRDRPIFQN